MDTRYFHNPPHNTMNEGRQWSPGLFSRLPWLGFGALLGTILGIAASIGILIVSNGQPIADWYIQPTVWLSVASTFSNIMLHFALAEGVNVAWWRRTMKKHTQLADLHRNWDFGNNRASRASVNTVTSTTTLSLSVAPGIPYGFTGYVSGRGYEASLYTSNYTSTVQDYNKQTAINIEGTTECQGICKGAVKGVGLAINCSSYTVPFDLNPHLLPNGSWDSASDPAFVNGTTVFQTFFQWTSLSGVMSLNVQYKDTLDCAGELVLRNCTMMTAQVLYPVVVDSNKSTIALDPESTIFNDTIDHVIEISDPTSQGPATLAGYYLALKNKFDSEALLKFGGAVPYILLTTGSAATQDPTFDIIASARDLMFRTAVATANTSTTQRVVASQTVIVAVYLSQYRYLVAASVITAAAVVIVSLTFYGYWHLGRKVTMSPIETAKAFNAPLLRNYDSNAEVKSLIREMGDRSVRYGATYVDVAPESHVDGKENLHAITPQVASRWQIRLELADERVVQAPKKGWKFSG